MTNYDFTRQPNETKFQHLVRVSVDKINKLHNKDWTDIKEEFKFEHSSDNLRKYAKGWSLMAENGLVDDTEQPINTDDSPIIKYKETTEILNDGTQRSDRVIEMSPDQSKDAKFLLESHGFNTDEWEITSAKNSIWNANTKADGIKTLYSSKITVKPKTKEFNIDDAINELKKHISPIKFNKPTVNEGGLLEIPLFDLHFGIADLDYYKETLEKISSKITNKKWDTILFVIGQDGLHNDGFTGKTTSGTLIDKVDMEKAVQDIKQFYFTLITLAGDSSQNVNVVFSNGNHDQMVGYMFVQLLEVKFPDVNFDSQLKERKAFIWNDIFIGLTHGDKSGNRTTKAFLAEYGKQIATAKVVEVHTGHWHHEKSKDDFGIVVRTLSTGAKTDGYHYDNGFIGSMQRFQLFEYSEDALEAIYYV